MAVSQKIRELPHDPAFLPRVYTRKNEKQRLRYLYTHIHSSIIHNNQKVVNNPNVHRQMKKMCYIHTMRYYSALKKEILTHIVTWTNLEDTMLSEISQTQKAKYCMTETEGRTAVTRAWG